MSHQKRKDCWDGLQDRNYPITRPVAWGSFEPDDSWFYDEVEQSKGPTDSLFRSSMGLLRIGPNARLVRGRT